MITSNLFFHYLVAIDKYEASLGFFGRTYAALCWRLRGKSWCPRCQQVVKWQIERGDGYEKKTCICGLTIITTENGQLYDIEIKGGLR
jgi:hypothetical protein